jgi:glucan-binding YG repeat protein
MKKRKSLLLGLGIIITLSMAVPASAAVASQGEAGAVTDTKEAGVTGEGLNNDTLPDPQNNAKDDSKNDVKNESENEKQAEAVWNTVTVTEDDVEKTYWTLTMDGSLVCGQFVKIGEATFYFDENGYMATGVVDYVKLSRSSEDPSVLTMPNGTYYFAETEAVTNAVNPVETGLGKMQTETWSYDSAAGKWLWYNAQGTADNTGKDGWQNINGNWYSLDAEGKPAADKTEWQKVDESTNTWYFLNADGSVDKSRNGWMETSGHVWLKAEEGKAVIQTGTTGWQQVKDNTWYCLKDDGTRDTSKTGEQSINGSTYYLNADGVAQTGFQTIGQNQYYFANDGKRQNYTGWQTIDQKPYYFNGYYQVTSTSVNGWQKVGNNWYWLENGKIATGWKKSGKRWFYMDPATGIMKTGFYYADGSKYYSDGDGAMVEGGWNLIGNTWYFMQNGGAIAGGWFQSGNARYYLGNDGAMRIGWFTADGARYYADGSGALHTSWLQQGADWYFFTNSGNMAFGWVKDGKSWYYLNSNGVMATGLKAVDGKYYYLDGSGAMQTGWMLLNGKWYYFNADGSMAAGWIKVGNAWYYLNAGGIMLTGWQTIDGVKYYLYADGAMAANRWIDGYYYVTASGAMAVSSWIDQYWVGADGRWVPGYDKNFSNASWVKHGDNWYYERPDGSRLCSAWKKLNGNWFRLDTDGRMVTGWKYIDGLKYYFNSDGHLVQDLDGIVAKQSSYRITVDRVRCQVTVYANDGGNGYIIPVKTLTCSVGLPGTPTPAGQHVIYDKQRWFELMGPSYGQYVSKITSNIYFHSVAGSNTTSYNLSAGAFNMLGQPASHGCIRLNVRDAKWIYDTCPIYQSKVTVGDNLPAPFDKPATIKIPAGQNWDPTDPNIP